MSIWQTFRCAFMGTREARQSRRCPDRGLTRNRRIALEPLEKRRLLSVADWLDNDLPRVYVDADAPSGGDGTSWVMAYNDLDLAVDAAAALVDPGTPGMEHVEVWIAEGTYVPARRQDAADPRSATFALQANTTLVGGFAGTEASPSQRARDGNGLLVNETVLNGDLGVAGDLADNAYTVVYAGSKENLVFDGLTISGGNANGSTSPQSKSGGGMYLSGGSATISDVTFVDNRCTYYGGALRLYSITVTIDACRFTNNHAALEGTSVPHGGAINISDSRRTSITNSFFEGNTADDRSGAIEAWNTTTVMEDSSFCGNESGSAGAGAVYVHGSPLLATRVFFEDNTTAGEGGAVYADFSSSFRDCSFLANQAAEVGGGAFSRVGSSSTFEQCEFVGNRADMYGGGLYISAGEVKRSTFTANHSNRGGGLAAGDGGVMLTSTLIAGNTAATAGPDVFSFYQLDAEYSLVGTSSGWPNAANYIGQYGNVIGTAADPVDPLFVRVPSDGGDGWTDDSSTSGIDESVNNDYGDLHPQPASPAVNAGLEPAQPYLVTDLDGHPRVVHGTIDIGAYENQNHPPVAEAGGPYAVLAGGSILLDGSASADQDSPHDWLSYAWDFDDDGQFDDATGPAPVFSATGLAIGTSVAVALQVTDTEGAVHADTATIDVVGGPAVTGTVFHDLDEDGVRDVDEPGLEGWTVFWDVNENGLYDSTVDVATLTLPGGDYSLLGISDGNLMIGELPVLGWPQTYPAGTGFHTVTVAGDIVGGVGFGNRGPVPGIHGTLWDDYNRDGVADPNEPVLAGWTVFLDLDDDGEVDGGEPTAITGLAGVYELPNPGAGTYTVAVVIESPWLPTVPADGTQSVTVADGEILLGVDFGAMAPRFYVDADATPGGDGGSWATAFHDLDLAVDAASSFLDLSIPGVERVELWIAEGTYVPTRLDVAGDARSATFAMHENTSLVGGFVGTETSADQRLHDAQGILVHETVLSGDIGIEGDAGDNAYTVVYSYRKANVIVDGVTIAQGYANRQDVGRYASGAGVFLDYGSATFQDVTFVDNRCVNYGAALRPYGTNVTLVGCRFLDNHAILDGSSTPRGGAINIAWGTAQIRQCLFEGNTADSRSGAVDLWFTPTTIEESVFRWNQSGNHGAGAVYHNGASLTCERVTFIANATGGDGGAVHSAGQIFVSECAFLQNSATNGGGLYRGGTEASSISQSVFVGNTATQGGGALRANGETIVNSTIAGNHARYGGGIFCGVMSTPEPLLNTIVAGNSADVASDGPDVFGYFTSDHSLIGNSNRWSNALDYIGLYGNLVGTPEVPLDPLFVRPPSDGGDGWGDDPATPGLDESANDDLGELHPQVASPAVNAGQATTSPPAADFDGHPRIVHGVIDIGAYEHQNLAPLADAGGPYGVASEGIVTLNAAASSDPDAPHDWIASYAWDFDGDGIFDDAAGVAPFFSAAGLAGPTSVSVTVRVTDSEGAAHVDPATVYVFGAPVRLEGTAGCNTITVTPGSAVENIDHVVNINGTLYTYSALAVGEIHIDGLDGTDTIIIHGTDQNETAALQPGSVDVAGQTYQVHAVNVEVFTVNGAAGNDTVTMTGSDGSNRLFSYAGYNTLTDSTRLFQHRVENFETVTVNVSGDGPNSAFLYDSSESDVLAVEPAFAELKRADGSTVRTATGFQQVYAYATEGAADTATLTGMPDAANRFYGYADYSLFTESRRSFYFYVRGFDTVTATSPGTGTAYGYLYDSPGIDAFTASTTSATMNRQDPWSDTIASGFTRIYAYSTGGGADTAELTGSAAGGNTYRGYPAYSTLYDASQSFYHYVRGFRSVTATGSASDTAGDRAYLYDSMVADTFRGEGVSALLEDTAQRTYRMEAVYFDLVYARSSDDAETEDTVEIIGELAYNLIRWGTW